MDSTLPATHLLRQFVLFALTVVFLLLVARAGYALWQFPAVEEAGSPVRLFLTGLRFDLSLVGAICLVPIVLGPLLAMFERTRALAKALVLVFLVGGLALVLVTELVTPPFIESAGERPDAAAFADPAVLVGVAARHPLPAVLGAVLALMILFAYVMRIENGRLLRHRLSRPSAILLAVVGGFACLVLARSELNFLLPPLWDRPSTALGGPPLVDELAMNSAWTTLRSLAEPYLDGGP